MANISTLAAIASLTLLMGALALAQDPFAGGAAAAIRADAKLDPTPLVYEVSKAGGDQNRLLQIFAAVRSACGGTLTKEEFVRRLKAREHFEISYPEKCRTCNGWRRLIPDRGQRGADGKVNCATCRGRGFELRPYIVKWSAAMNTHLGDRRDPLLAGLRRELGDAASALVWFSAARRYHEGELRDRADSRAIAHAAYQEAIALANAEWRHDQPTNSESNRIRRKIIDDGLAGIAATAPEREGTKVPE